MGEYAPQRYRCPDCDSSNGLAMNHNGSGYCHACPEDVAYKRAAYLAGVEEAEPAEKRAGVILPKGTGSYEGFPARGISPATAKFYNVTTLGDTVTFTYDNDSAKVRNANKDFVCTGNFKAAGLFGANLFSAGGRTVMITEGEFDALAAFQMQGSKWPVVSIKNGAQAALKDCKAHYNYLNSFETIVICFDADAPGVRAAAEVAELFSDKAKIMKHQKGHKDACDYLAAGDKEAFINAFWRAEQYVPEGVVLSGSLHDELMSDVALPFCRYPWDGMNLLFYGMRFGEIVTLTAGSGVGKSTIVKQILEAIYNDTEEKIGVLSLEETVKVAAQGMMSLAANKPLHLPTKKQMVEHILRDPSNISRKPHLADEITMEEREAAYQHMLASNRFLFLEHKGRITKDTVLGQIRYLAKGQDCKVVLLDHVSILVGLAAKKQSLVEAIDEVMHDLRAIVEETGVLLLLISHLRKSQEGGGHEEGARVHLSELRGSGAIAQLSNIAFALEGNRQADSAAERNTTTVRALKNRFSGELGIACHLEYSQVTGRHTEVDYIDMEDAL